MELSDRYIVTSNRESGYGRYDVMIEPKDKNKYGFIFEFKVHDPNSESNLQHTVQAALDQIEKKQYDQALLDHGMDREHIKKYGFAFQGKRILIGSST